MSIISTIAIILYFIVGAISCAFTIYHLRMVEVGTDSTVNDMPVDILVAVIMFFAWLPVIIWVKNRKKRGKNVT